MTAVFILLVIGSYLLGAVPWAYLIARWRRGIDIRKYGSGNVGAANVLTAVSKRWSVAVTLLDIGKGALMVWIAQLIGLSVAQQVTIGIAAIVGHDWPVFLRFQGGRGVFTTLGVIIMLNPWLGLTALVFPYLFFAPFKQVSMGVTLVLVILPCMAGFAYGPLGIAEPLPVLIGIIWMLIIMMTRRFTAPRSPISADVHVGKLLLYRLLFDRDIRDRETWIKQDRAGETAKEG